MTILTLDNKALYYSFLSGAKQVINEKNSLNEINVFPVPDGDTGTNLASMMQTILDEAQLEQTHQATLMSLADAAMVGARGNSGIIFAQYLNGLLESLENDETISLDVFIDSLNKAVPYAYRAISNPVEGTMITVMREFSESMQSMRHKSKDFVNAITDAYAHAKVALQNTTNQLKVLKDSNVVDAGAKGFVHFIEGFLNYLKTGNFEAVQKTDADIAISHIEHIDNHNQTYRYCTEALLSGDSLNVEAVRSAIEKYGDSLVVAGNSRKLRLHIHTNNPQHVFYDLRNFGNIIDQKVDDMTKQYEVAHHRKYRIALVTDSIADLPQEYVDQYQIHVIPVNLMIEDSNYYDKLTITSDRFYQFMDELSTYPTSAQPNIKTIENYYSFLSSYYDEIMVITVSQKMSGTYGAFVKAAERFKNTATTIKVIDSKQNSGAEGLLVMKAAEMIAENQSLDAIVDFIEHQRDAAQILVSVQTLKYMVRSGRVKKTVGIIGKITNLKPVISIDKTGEGIIFDKGFSLKSSNKKIMNHVQKVHQSPGIERYAIVHANAPERAKEYALKFTELTGNEPLYTMDISTVVAMSAGIGTVAIAYLERMDSTS